MKNKTLTKKMKADLTSLVMSKIMTEPCHNAMMQLSQVALAAYANVYGEPKSQQQLGYDALPESIMPLTADLPVSVKKGDLTKEIVVQLPVMVRFQKGMTPPVLEYLEVEEALNVIKQEGDKNSHIKALVEAAVEDMPGTLKACQLWPEIQPYVIALFYKTIEEQREGVPESIALAKDAIDEFMSSTFEEDSSGLEAEAQANAETEEATKVDEPDREPAEAVETTDEVEEIASTEEEVADEVAPQDNNE